jgi:hypothetical protein
MTQVHDFNPGITPNGVFWIVEVPDDAVKISPDGETLTIHLENVSVVDQGSFPAGTGTTPATVSFDITYTKSGAPRHVRPISRDPLSPFNWAGEMWTATNSGTFSVAYNDKSFLAQGTFSSDFLPAGNFGEMGTERNGSFVEREDAENDAEVNTQEGQTQKAQVTAKATTSDPVGAAETIMALRSSRAKALRALKSKL